MLIAWIFMSLAFYFGEAHYIVAGFFAIVAVGCLLAGEED